jgi:hypothetical protein
LDPTYIGCSSDSLSERVRLRFATPDRIGLMLDTYLLLSTYLVRFRSLPFVDTYGHPPSFRLRIRLSFPLRISVWLLPVLAVVSPACVTDSDRPYHPSCALPDHPDHPKHPLLVPSRILAIPTASCVTSRASGRLPLSRAPLHSGSPHVRSYHILSPSPLSPTPPGHSHTFPWDEHGFRRFNLLSPSHPSGLV